MPIPKLDLGFGSWQWHSWGNVNSGDIIVLRFVFGIFYPPGLTHFAFQIPSLDAPMHKGKCTLLATSFISSLILFELIDKRVYNSKSVLVLYISLPARNTIEECVWFIFGRFIPAAVVGWCEAFLIWSAHQQKSIFIHIITKPRFCVLFFLWVGISPTIHGKNK